MFPLECAEGKHWGSWPYFVMVTCLLVNYLPSVPQRKFCEGWDLALFSTMSPVPRTVPGTEWVFKDKRSRDLEVPCSWLLAIWGWLRTAIAKGSCCWVSSLLALDVCSFWVTVHSAFLGLPLNAQFSPPSAHLSHLCSVCASCKRDFKCSPENVRCLPCEFVISWGSGSGAQCYMGHRLNSIQYTLPSLSPDYYDFSSSLYQSCVHDMQQQAMKNQV